MAQKQKNPAGLKKPSGLIAAQNKREIPDPVAFMKAHQNEGSAAEEAAESPALEQAEQAFGIDKPTQGDSAKNGFAAVNSHGGSVNGRKEPASNFRGSGKVGPALSPNNQSHAGSMATGKPAFGMPSKAAIQRRIQPAHKAAGVKKHQGKRTGILSKFEGLNNIGGK